MSMSSDRFSPQSTTGTPSTMPTDSNLQSRKLVELAEALQTAVTNADALRAAANTARENLPAKEADAKAAIAAAKANAQTAAQTAEASAKANAALAKDNTEANIAKAREAAAAAKTAAEEGAKAEAAKEAAQSQLATAEAAAQVQLTDAENAEEIASDLANKTTKLSTDLAQRRVTKQTLNTFAGDVASIETSVQNFIDTLGKPAKVDMIVKSGLDIIPKIIEGLASGSQLVLTQVSKVYGELSQINVTANSPAFSSTSYVFNKNM